MSKCSQPIVMMVAHPPQKDKEFFYTHPFYVDSLRNSGASIIIVTPGEKCDCLENMYNLCDGIMLTGGGDINPNLYGGDVNAPNVYDINDSRDQTEFKILDYAIKGGKPLLAICRGFHMVNIKLGGDLYEDVSLMPAPKQQHRLDQNKGIMHEVKLAENSCILKKAIDEAVKERNASHEDVLQVLSWHHQSIKKLASGLSCVAESEDGTIEAFEMLEHPWLLGVQFHPELCYENDIKQKFIFDHFVEACSKLRKMKV